MLHNTNLEFGVGHYFGKDFTKFTAKECYLFNSGKSREYA